MKKIIGFISAIIIVVSGLSVTSYAITEYVGEYNYDYTTKAVVTAKIDGTERAKFYYYPGNGSSTYCRSYTSVYLYKYLYGYAASTTTAINGTSEHKYWGGQAQETGWYYSPTAKVDKQQYAKSLYYYADVRIASNTISTVYKMYGH